MTKLPLAFLESHTAFIGVGSNLGDKPLNCLTAVDLLGQMDGITVERRSSLYRSEALPLPDPDAPPPGPHDWFVNAVVRVKTALSPKELLAAMHLIEMQLLRQRDVRWGPRTLDLDLLFYDQLVLEMDGLTIPHPEIHKRSFVLVPMAEIAPRWVHPCFNKAIAQLVKDLDELQTPCVPLTLDLSLNQGESR